MRRVLLLSAVLFLSPVVSAYGVAVATTDPDEGANIGGGILVLLSIPVGLVLGITYFVVATARRRK